MLRANFATRGAEARLYAACAAAIGLPVGIFIYAWTSFSNVHWMAPVVGITVSIQTIAIFLGFTNCQLLIWATYIMYLAVFTYLADA